MGLALDKDIERDYIKAIELYEEEIREGIASLDSYINLAVLYWLFAIDDFGVGYSNLSQLKTLNCDYLKIDRSFVMDMEDNSIRSSLIPHIVSIAEGLNVDLIAEGVENIDQCNELKGLTIGFGQGWLFGKPQSADALAKSVQGTQ